jgi:rhodanese-related sulfurtransferase
MAFRPYNPSMAKPKPLFQTPSFSSLRQAIDWVALAGTWALLFNVLHTSGIELKVRPDHEKASASKQAAPKTTEQEKPSYSGWASSGDTAKKASSKTSKATATSSTPNTLAEWQARFPHLSVVGAKAAWDNKKTIFIDSRKPTDYAEGHIARAVNFYADEYDEWAPKVMGSLPPDKTYVIYCNGTTCDLSHHLAVKLQEQGYQDLKIFFNGWSQWKKAGYPMREGSQP